MANVSGLFHASYTKGAKLSRSVKASNLNVVWIYATYSGAKPLSWHLDRLLEY